MEEESSHLLPVYRPYPFKVEKAKGIHLYDTKGNSYIDFLGGHGNCILGHSVEEISNTLYQQSKEFMFYSNLIDTSLREKAAEKLLTFCDTGHSSVFFCNSSDEANDNALKLALKLSGRKRIASFNGSFHGRTALTMSVTDFEPWHRKYALSNDRVDFIDPNNIGEFNKINYETAAVIIEPIQVINACKEFDFSFLNKLREHCDSVGAFLIFDETLVGIGRTGYSTIASELKVFPDILTLSNGIANGFPAAALLLSPDITEDTKPGDLGSITSGAPLAMSLISKTIDLLLKNKLLSHIKLLDEIVDNSLNFAGTTSHGRGFLRSIKLEQAAKPLQYSLFSKGFITGLNSNPKHLSISPPYITTEEDILLFANTLNKLLISSPKTIAA